jgi:DNA-binding SARP family transcriptional activator/predicted ATPase
LGPFQASLDGEPLSGFASDKVRALLVYLALSPDQPHRREALAGLLWPDFPERSARTNLRNALANLRRVLLDREAALPFLHSTRQTIQFNGRSDYSLDAEAFEDLAATPLPEPERLERAVGLARGAFLEGFTLADAAPFEEWLLLRREHYGRQLLEALERLTTIYGRQGLHEQALVHARRRVALEPWDEDGQRQLMRLLAYGGRSAEALAAYEKLAHSLREELAAEPSTETTMLCGRIRDGQLEAPPPFLTAPPGESAELPAFLVEGQGDDDRSVFVARERELGQLDQLLARAREGRGQAVFVTGEAGSGKTALIHEFSRRAQRADPKLVVAIGNCNAHTGIGDPYLPFREILELLTGGVEAKWAARAIASEHARRLWHALPTAGRALVEAGPDLVGTFVRPVPLLERARTHADWFGSSEWLARLGKLVDGQASGSGMPTSHQTDLFEQYTNVLKALAPTGPLVLVVDDLQWADSGSIGLLFHLGKRIAASRILVMGAYRPEAVAGGSGGARHPLEPVVNELQRDYGHALVNVDQARSREFLGALLDARPNRLGEAFRDRLYRQTQGHPLFTVELLQGLRERGQLIQDREGYWVATPALDWEILPPRVEAVIAERTGRLPEPLQGTLRAASVQGETFTAEVLSHVMAADEEEMVSHLSGDLTRRHGLVRAQGIGQLGGQRLSQYRFRHILFQQYLYNNLDEVERAHLHKATGMALEDFYWPDSEEALPDEAADDSAVQLAWHFEKAGIAAKAIHYLRLAGERAVRLSAYGDALTHLSRGLDLLTSLPVSPERDQLELPLQLALGIASIGHKSYEPQGERAYKRARELCQKLGEKSLLCFVLGRLAMFRHLDAEHQEARVLADQALALAQAADDPLHVALGHRLLGTILFCLGEHMEARAHLGQMIDFYRPGEHHRALVRLRGSDAGTSALAYDACCLWCLGYPDQAARRSREVLSLARRLAHPFSLADALRYGGGTFNRLRREPEELKDCGEELIRLASEKIPAWGGAGTFFSGAALVTMGRAQEGLVQIRQAMTSHRAKVSRFYRSGRLLALASAQAQMGDVQDGLATLDEALELVEASGERLWEPEIHRVRAELLLAKNDATQAEPSLWKAIEVSRRQRARSFELRATTSLARLWQRQGRIEEARALLAPIYGWFTEGFDTCDLNEARALLGELSEPLNP